MEAVGWPKKVVRSPKGKPASSPFSSVADTSLPPPNLNSHEQSSQHAYPNPSAMTLCPGVTGQGSISTSWLEAGLAVVSTAPKPGIASSPVTSPQASPGAMKCRVEGKMQDEKRKQTQGGMSGACCELCNWPSSYDEGPEKRLLQTVDVESRSPLVADHCSSPCGAEIRCPKPRLPHPNDTPRRSECRTCRSVDPDPNSEPSG